MTAQVGADGGELFGDPRPKLLAHVTGLPPEPPRGERVDLEEHLHFYSTQRLQITYRPDGSGVVVATWPAELARQARPLYGHGLGSALVAAAIERGWKVEPSPHIGFVNSRSYQRLYMRPRMEPFEYVACWEDKDALGRVRYAREDAEPKLWRWLKQNGFADDRDDDEFRHFLDKYLGNRDADMRPGLRFRREWTPDEEAELGSALAETIRSDFDAVFAVAGEPSLRSASPDLNAP
jgi:hypothetical protein